MTIEQKKSIEDYIRRSIPDIARKCQVTNDEVLLVMSEFVPCEMKQQDDSNDDYVIIQWPEIQDYMDVEGFDENSCLVSTEPMLTEYGSSAYFVNKGWLKSLPVCLR